MQFNEYVRSERIKRSMQPKDLANEVGVHPTFIRSIERGNQTPSANTALKICEVFGTARLVDDWTVETNGYSFSFKASVRGQNRKPEDHAISILSWH